MEGGLEGEVFRVPVSDFILAQAAPNGILIQLLMSRNLVLLHIQLVVMQPLGEQIAGR